MPFFVFSFGFRFVLFFFFLLNILALVNGLKKTSSVSLIFASLAFPFCHIVYYVVRFVL